MSSLLTPSRKLWTPKAERYAKWFEIARRNPDRVTWVDGIPVPNIAGGVPPTVYGTFVTKAGIAVEATSGVPPAANPSRMIPTLKPIVKDNINWYADASYRGVSAKTFGHYQLQGLGEVELNGPFYPDASGYSLLGSFGQDVVTVAPTSTTLTGAGNVAGVSTITVTSGVGFVNGAAILIGAGATQEGNLIISGGGTASLVLAGPLRFTHAAAEAVAGATLHQFAMNNPTTPPKTFTVWDYYGVDWRQYTFCTVEETAFKWMANTEATYQSKMKSWLSTIPTTPTAPAYSTVPPFMGWQSGFFLNGAAQTNLEELEFACKRTLVPVPGPTNSQNPASIFAAELAVTGRALLQMSTEAEYNQFRSGLGQSLKFALFGPQVGIVGAAGATGMLLQLSQPAYTLGQIMRSKEYVECELTWEADYNATDAGPGTVFLTNAYATYT